MYVLPASLVATSLVCASLILCILAQPRRCRQTLREACYQLGIAKTPRLEMPLSREIEAMVEVTKSSDAVSCSQTLSTRTSRVNRCSQLDQEF
jgi:hypothetical protein